MKSNFHIIHPATMYLLLTLFVVFLSWICNIYGLSVRHPQTDEMVTVHNLLSPEGVRWILRNIITNFTEFAPLGTVVLAMFGLGVATHSGLLHSYLRYNSCKQKHPHRVILLVILLGILSNFGGEIGYIILLPVAAILFHSNHLNPIGGIVTTFVSVACGYHAGILLNPLDQTLSGTTQEAAVFSAVTATGPLSNYFFMCASLFLLTAIIYFVTTKMLLPGLGEYKGGISIEIDKPLSQREKKAMNASLISGAFLLLLLCCFMFSSSGFLRNVNGSFIQSPFMVGMLFIISFVIGAMGIVYGFISGRYRNDTDVVKGLAQPVKFLGVYVVIVFFAAQMFSCIAYTKLDQYLSIYSAELFSSMQFTPVTMLVLFVIYIALINVFVPSTTSKWMLIAFIIVPVFTKAGITPEITQCAYCIGDSATNAITPLLLYVPLTLAYLQFYAPDITYADLFRYTWRYSLFLLIVWPVFFILWVVLHIPLGF